MSYYDTKKIWLPPVRTCEWKRDKIYTLADMFTKSYTDLVNDWIEYFQIDSLDMQGKRLTYDQALIHANGKLVDYYARRNEMQKREKKRWSGGRYGRL